MRDDTHYVYVIAKLADGKMTSPVKVGISAEPNARLACIQTACPFQIDIAYVFECPSREIAREIERAFHATQAAARLCGEWFDHHPIAAIHLLCLLYRTGLEVKVRDPELIAQALEISGVILAEKRFGLAAPTGAALQ
jgi:hypothetical protein